MSYFVFLWSSFLWTQNSEARLSAWTHTHKPIPRSLVHFTSGSSHWWEGPLRESQWSMEKEDRSVSFQTTQIFWGTLILLPQPYLQRAASHSPPNPCGRHIVPLGCWVQSCHHLGPACRCAGRCENNALFWNHTVNLGHPADSQTVEWILSSSQLGTGIAAESYHSSPLVLLTILPSHQKFPS